ncbi:MAG: hypothetical protein KDB27_36025 [Planctomycetales bacterium]|nr:hypothetical protein [Planctomycetales bacterium]
MRCRFIKLGGSLLARADLRQRFRDWLEKQPAADRTIVLVGGGAIVNAVRDLDSCHQLASNESHWLAIRAMAVSAELFTLLFPDFEVIHELPGHDQQGTFVLDAYDCLHALPESKRTALPEGWHVTSDSIAGFLSSMMDADELVLLKSKHNSFSSIQLAADAGFVDSFFPEIAANCRSIRFATL